MLGRNLLRPPVQLFKPLLHLTPARFASLTMRTVWAVNSQAGQQVADPISQVHNHLPGLVCFRRRTSARGQHALRWKTSTLLIRRASPGAFLSMGLLVAA